MKNRSISVFQNVERGPLQCGCGLPFGTLRAVKGRMLDYFRLPGGRMMHPYEITNPIRDSAWIGRYQLVQLREDHIVLRIVVREPPAAGELVSA